MAGSPGGDRSDTATCNHCDAPLSASMRYCPSCGTRQEASPSGDGSTSQRPPRSHGQHGGDDSAAHRDADRSSTERQHRSRSAAHSSHASDTDARRSSGPTHDHQETDRQLLERRIATALENGWELEHDFGDHAVLVDRSLGSVGTHLLIAMFTVWFTMGMGNALYAGYKYFSDVDRKVVRPDRVHRADSQRTAEHRTASGSATERRSGSRATGTSHSDSGPTARSTARYAGATKTRLSAKRIFGVGLLWLFGLALLSDGSLLESGFGLLLLVTGAAMVPSIRRRFRDRDTITTNGRTQSVTETPVRSPDRPCVVCHRSFEAGIERTYRERFRLLGVSLVTTDRGDNYYCRECAGLETDPQERTDTGTDEIDERGDSASATRTDPDPDLEANAEPEPKSEPEFSPSTPDTDTTDD